MPTGSCHCGQVKVFVPEKPSYGNACRCSICRRYGVIWGYWDPAEVRIEALADDRDFYSWGERSLLFGRCARCGTVIDWQQEARAPAPSRMAVNLRLFEPADLEGVPIRESPGPD